MSDDADAGVRFESPMAQAPLWSSDEAELLALERLYEQVDTIQHTGMTQQRAQHAALAALENERHAVEHSLRELDMCDQREAANCELILGSIQSPVKRFKPLLRRQDLSAMPLLQSHAAERRRTRALLSSPPWSMQDMDSLRTAVSNEIHRQEVLYGHAQELDWHAVAMYVPYHTAADCRTRYHFYEQALMNHARWSAVEKKELAALVDTMSPLSWEEVAQRLGTGRSGYQALETYQRGVKPVMEWTPERDEALLRTVRETGPIWKVVAAQLGYPPLCASLCHQRHNKLKSSGLVMGRWSATEDAALRAAVAKYGCDWKRVEICVPGRTGQQCRERWVGRLANIPEGETHAVRRAWSKEEDDRLRACVHTCKTWVQVAEFVGGRSDKMVRERWLLLKKRDEEEERRRRGEPIPPRRGSRAKAEQQSRPPPPRNQ